VSLSMKPWMPRIEPCMREKKPRHHLAPPPSNKGHPRQHTGQGNTPTWATHLSGRHIYRGVTFIGASHLSGRQAIMSGKSSLSSCRIWSFNISLRFFNR
jgi:hypothetical protein